MTSDSNDMKAFIGLAANGEALSREQAEAAFGIIMSGEATPSQIGGFLMEIGTDESKSRDKKYDDLCPVVFFGESDCARLHCVLMPMRAERTEVILDLRRAEREGVSSSIRSVDFMSRTIGVSSYLANLIVATSLMTMLLASLAMRYRIRLG